MNENLHDWREPLYQSAVFHMESDPNRRLDLAVHEFSFLGSYKDSRSRITSCRREIDGLIDQALHSRKTFEALKANNLLRTYKQIDGFVTAVALSSLEYENHQEITYGKLLDALDTKKKELHKQEVKRRKRKAGILIIAAVIVATVMILLFARVIPSRQTTMQERNEPFLQEKSYEDALECAVKESLETIHGTKEKP